MTMMQIQPWSDVDDDEVIDLAGIDSAGPSTAEATGAAPLGGGHIYASALSREERELQSRTSNPEGQSTRLAPHRAESVPSWLGRLSPTWATALLGAAVAMLCGGIGAGGLSGASRWWTIGAGLLTVSGTILLYLGIVNRKWMAERTCRALTTEGPCRREDVEGLSGEFARILDAATRRTSNLTGRLNTAQSENRRLKLELSLADMQKRQSQAIIDSISDAVLVTDAGDRLVLANPAAEGLFGFKLEAAHRMAVSELVNNPALAQAISQARLAYGRSTDRRLEIECGERAFAVTLSRVSSRRGGGPAEAGEANAVVTVLRDITRDREVAKVKNQFVAQVSHELRTPLSSIKAYVEMLVDGEAADEQTRGEYYEIIQTSADRLGRMIDNMLNISRIEAGTVRISKEPVSVAVVVSEAADAVRPQAEAKRIEFTQSLTPGPYRIMADRDLIHQAVLNLMSNAIKYTPEGGKVSVVMAPNEQSGTVAIQVTDTGIGIPKEDLPRMFEKFFRVEASKKMAKGTGLGLNLVKHIVETVHEGKVTLASEVGKGSTFGIVLPLMV